jgi:glycosyltransferase involved in cell wall biosynthesis
VPPFLSGLDVLCHAVDAETLDCNPIAVLEALAAGVPVVAERRGGLPELVEHGVNGLLADDPEEVGELLGQLSRNRALVRRLAAGARASAARFDRATQLSAYAELIESLARPAVATPPLAAAASSAA